MWPETSGGAGGAARDLLLEIGCEEIPARMLARAIADLPAQAAARLASARLTHGDVRVLGTPRRLAVLVRGLGVRQADLSERVAGPPVSAAFGPDGAPTKAAIGFAQKNGVDAAALERGEVAGKKGQYAIANRFVAGEPTEKILPALLAELIASIAWPKSQRWGWGETVFVRPLQWLVALYGDAVVPVAHGGITAGRDSRGHRFLAAGAVRIPSPAAYVETLRQAFVVVEPEVRRDMIRGELLRIEAETKTRVRADEGLLDEVTHLVEYPVGVVGGFDPSYLEVPAEIIVTAMRTHQRYFALEDRAGALAPRFVTVAGMITRSPELVRQGNERVLAARLADAKFFFAEDRKKPMSAWNDKLDSVVFQAKLGERARTIGDKIRRIETTVAAIVHELGPSSACDGKAAARAACLCKADLASGVVGEFPELQGVMGMHYARLGGEGERVALAIAEHYLPKGQGSGLPATPEGALVGLADRLDTLVGCFATGLEPSGSADPYGLRRAALGVLAILLDRGAGGAHHEPAATINLHLGHLVGLAVASFHGTVPVTEHHRHALLEFFRTRLRGLLLDEGLAAQDVDAALGAGFDDPGDARARARDLAVVPAPAREVFKRIANILDEAAAKGAIPKDASGLTVDERKFVAPGNAEWRLHEACAAGHARIQAAVAARRYRELFGVLVELQPAVAAFFERGDKGGVMVMDPDPALRTNRLALLHQLIAPFAKVADFRLLAQPAGASGPAA